MELTIRERILKLLKNSPKFALTSEEIAKELKLSKRQVQEANRHMVRQKRILSQGDRPGHFTYNFKYDESDKLIKEVPSPPKRSKKVDSTFKFNGFLILYVTEDSSIPIMLQDFRNVEELTDKFQELQESEDIVSIAAYKKLDAIQKYELRL